MINYALLVWGTRDKTIIAPKCHDSLGRAHLSPTKDGISDLRTLTVKETRLTQPGWLTSIY